MTFLAAAMQLGPASPTIRDTVARVLKLIDEAGEAGVKLAVLPELALTPYFAAAIHDNLDVYTSAEENQWALETIAARVKGTGLALAVPFAELAGNRVYNSMTFLNAEGERVGTFRKVHIPGQLEPKADGTLTIMEKRYFAPGDNGFAVFAAGDIKLGGLICYDRRFPESYRSLSINGADVICIGYNTPVMPGGTLGAARQASELAMRGGAYSNATYVIGTGKAGTEGGVRYIGGSLIISPDGTVMKRAKTRGDELVIAEIDLEKQKAVRERWNFEVNRRPTEYVMTAAV